MTSPLAKTHMETSAMGHWVLCLHRGTIGRHGVVGVWPAIDDGGVGGFFTRRQCVYFAVHFG